MIVRGRGISKGTGTGPVLMSTAPLSFLSGVDPDTGIVIETGHPLCGKSISGTVLVFPYGKGSTVGSYVIYALVQNGRGPAAIINREAEPIIAVGAIISGVPMIDRVDIDTLRNKDGIQATVNGDTGELEYTTETVPGPQP
jgi:predicted aconitase with swiveling domain